MLDRLPLILSATALTVAVLGATPFGEAAYNAVVPKNSVGPAQLRKGAVTNVALRGDAVTSGKVKNRSLKAIDFKLGQLPAGPPGPQGEKGEKGEKGSKGDTGAPGLSGYEVVTNTLAPTTSQSISVTTNCPAGKTPIGGGVSNGSYNTANGPFMVRSVPVGNGWSVTVAQYPPMNVVVIGYAICATVAP